MTNYGAKILNNSVGALRAHQALIAVTGNNIQNANTPGYVKRTVNLQSGSSAGSSAGLNIGNGVSIGNLVRSTSEYLNKLVREASSSSEGAQIEQSYIQRLEGLFDLTGQKPTIGNALTAFFNAFNDLSANPGSIEIRSNVLARMNDLTNVIKSTFNSIASLQEEADVRIGNELEVVNGLTAQIATLNGLIQGRESGGSTIAADERDQRDRLMEQLSQKLSFQSVEQSDGSVLINLPNGFPLVSGTTSRNLEFTETPSFAATTPFSLAGQKLGFIVYDNDPTAGGASHLDLTQFIKTGEGVIPSLLRVRGTNTAAQLAQPSAFQADGILVGAAKRVEAITLQLLTTVNALYRGPDEDAGTAGYQSSSRGLNGANPGPLGLFRPAGTIPYVDVNGNGLPDIADFDMSGVGSLSSSLQVVIGNPDDIAAALDLDPVGGSVLTAPGDGSNARAIAGLRNSTLAFALQAPNTFSESGTFDSFYNNTVTYVGNAKSSVDLRVSVAEDNLLSAKTQRDEVSGVSLDEEFTNLIKYQKGYEASARLIKIADDLMKELVNLI